MTTTLDTLRDADVVPAARLHRRAFPSFFLSSLGERFLVQFYRGFVDDETAITVVARDNDGRLVGVVVGTAQPAGFFSRLLRRQWFGFGIAGLRAVVRAPATLPRLVAAIRYRGDAGGRSAGALLSSICVEPDLQGAGVGRELIAEWTTRAARQGAGTAYLTTDAEGNDAVNAFYRSQGWQLAECFVTRQGRPMNRYQIRVDSRS